MLGVTQQTYARLEANPSKASFERLYKVLNILGVEISLSSAPLSTYTKPTNFVEKEFDSPARREEMVIGASLFDRSGHQAPPLSI